MMSSTRGVEAKDIAPYCVVLWHYLIWCFLTNVLGPMAQLCQDVDPLILREAGAELARAQG